MRTILQTLTFLAVIQAGLAAAEPTAYKRLSFDALFDGSLKPIKLSLEIPADYVHADDLETPDDSYNYWMKAGEVAGAKKTGDLPVKTGYVYGKLSLDVGYDKTKDKFSNEEDLEVRMKGMGMKLIETKKLKVNGYPVLSIIGQAKNGNMMCAMYVGVLIESNAVFVAYVPPGNDRKTGQAVWGKIIASLKAAG